MKGVFVSYRRSDSGGHAGRIHDRLVEYYGDARVFRDIEDIAAGADFVETIRDTLAKHDVLLVVIGPAWLSITDDAGRRRLDNPNDIVRLEVAEALNRSDIRVIPVLVNGATMPRRDELPAPLTSLATRNAFEVHDNRFADDVTALIKTIGGARAGRLRRVAIGAGLVTLAGAAGAILVSSLMTPAPGVAAAITLYRGDGEIEGNPNDAYVSVSLTDTAAFAENVPAQPQSAYTVSYELTRRDADHIAVVPVLPYLETLKTGGPITPAREVIWDWPRLSVQVVNNSNETVYINEVTIDVTGSAIDTEPVLMINEQYGAPAFGLSNIGWGAPRNLSIEIDFQEEATCLDADWVESDRSPLNLETASLRQTIGTDQPVAVGSPGTRALFDVSEHVPPEYAQPAFRQAEPLCLLGVMRYETENGTSRRVRFKTRIGAYGQDALASINPSDEHYLFLSAGQSGYVRTIPVNYELQPNGVEHFLLRIGTDKSASFDLYFGLGAVGGDLYPAGNVQLQVLSTINDPRFRRNQALHVQ